jgi:diazepam-binding inhibitor (GABA receptor modulating acyl-CoA-binding protein)
MSPPSSAKAGGAASDLDKLRAKFHRAVAYVQGNPAESKVTPAMQLAFYALFKQATVGPNKTPAPSRVKVVDYLKWEAWKNLKTLSSERAMKRYVKELKKEDADWKKKAAEAARGIKLVSKL